MISQSLAKELQIVGQMPQKINLPQFSSKRSLWIKDQSHPTIPYSSLTGKRYVYNKNGKLFSFERTRYLMCHNDVLFYFEEQKDNKFKGYCSFSNVYVAFHKLKSKRFLLYLSNGNQESYFFFENQDFYKSSQKSLEKYAVMLNFSDKYSIQSNLGKGSFSQVYLVKNRQNNQCFAAKVVSKLDKNKVPTRNLVLEERKILQNIESEFVYKLYQFYEQANNFIFILEYLSGKDLMTLYKENMEFSMADLIFIFKSILKGISDCHKAKIFHRDLKPQNILIDMTTLKPKIIDFGLSLLIEPMTELKSFKRCGTMGYMAPEVIANTAETRKPYTEKCDLFSLGIIAHMILLGCNPLKGKCYEETYANNRACVIDLKKDEIVEKYGQDGYNFLAGLLQKNHKKRFSAEQALNSPFLNSHPHSKQLIHHKEDSAQTASQQTKLNVIKSNAEVTS